LNFTGTDTIDSLFFGGIAQAVGTWGSPSSAATNKSPRFSGNGILQVTTLGVSMIPGDFDGDSDVDAADLTRWRSSFGVNAMADADADGDSDGNDFLIWQRNLGRTAPAGAATAAVPEPGSLALAGCAVMALGMMRRKRG
jgi:hypothetical protein